MPGKGVVGSGKANLTSGIGQPPAISLPKGGGAIRGIDEKFSVNPATGTASQTIPIFTSPGRHDFHPQLSLSYDSGAGNGPFGLGWNLSIPSITRKTDKGLPRYYDAEESDTFILSGAEDLVPLLVESEGGWQREELSPRSIDNIEFTVHRYRPRTEGLFARIERWRNQDNGETHWRSISKDNITTVYGKTPECRIADPDDSRRVFSWLIEESYDDKGNIIAYEYKQENAQNINPAYPQEKHRLNNTNGYANRYLKRIQYANTTAYQEGDWLFEVVFDYGEHDLEHPDTNEINNWPSRADAFSSYRAGFELRSQRLCHRVLMFHRFVELGETACLVRSTEFNYSENPAVTYLISTTHRGYMRDMATGVYTSKSFPPTEFSYYEPQLTDEIHYIDPESLKNLPVGLDNAQYQWLDLDGEGIAGILTEQAEGWFYKGNLGNGRFAPVSPVSTRPSLGNLQDRQTQFMDLAGDGHMDVVLLDEPITGFYERNKDEYWDNFIPFELAPRVNWRDPNLRLVDITGDGHADILITEDEVFTWYRSRGEQGFGPPEQAPKQFDEETGATMVLADATQSIYLTDMSGDGLSDIVRIKNAEVSYWPNLGYGRFGAKVTMDASPHFDFPDLFDQKRLHFADIDGSGSSDIIYFGPDVVKLWFNQAGNSWSEAQQLRHFPQTSNLADINIIDLFGNGTACLVWSSPLPADAGRPMRYIDLMGGNKPHLMKSIIDNMGTETEFQYASSTRFYLEDKAAGTPWITKLPFPVQVLERVETRELVTGSKLVNLYKYHHGYFDGEDREFRGFGMVEQWDTESFGAYNEAGLFTSLPNTTEEQHHLPPVYTKTWFHTGAYLDRQNISQQYIKEYYQGDPEFLLLPDTILDPGLSRLEQHEACRALKGSILRQEVYALDESPDSQHPYTVSEQIYELKRLQPVESNRHAVFFAHARQSLDYHYERNPDDPRISHALTLAVDDFGNVTESAAIVYPRRAPVYDEQARLLCTYSRHDFINHPHDDSFYRIGVPYQSRSYELSGLELNDPVFSLQDIQTAILDSIEINYEEQAIEGLLQKRLIEREQLRYYSNDLSGALPLGEVESLALPYESYLMAFTPELLQQVYTEKIDYNMLSNIITNEGGFVSHEGVWWDPSGYQVFDPALFYLPTRSIDPFGNEFTAQYDDYSLLIRRTEDPMGNIELADNDYRLLQPWMEIDANENRAAIQFDELGMVIASAEMGKETLNEGDTLSDPGTRLEYELFNWMHNRKPNFVHTLAREQHQDSTTRWQESYTYSDGMGREVSSKVQAEPGFAPARDSTGYLLHEANGDLTLVNTFPNVRWVGSGRKVFDNKGNPVKQYEPFFSNSHEYEDEVELVEWGVTPILHYDPLGRLIRTNNPDGTFSKVEFGPWHQRSFDESDTVINSDWYAERINLPVDDPQRRAAELSAQHYDTPAVTHLDTLGRSFLNIADNGDRGQYTTHTELDIEGNARVITDARGNPVMQYAYNMIGPSEEEEEGEDEEDNPDDHLIYQNSMDAGERWMLYNVVGNPIRSWDSRGHVFSYEYDALQRQTHFYVQTENELKILAEQTVYGESLIDPEPDPVTLNLRGQVYQLYDGAGVVTNMCFDFKDNLLESNRQLVTDYTKIPDWSQSTALEDESFTTLTSYDALNRPVEITTPDLSVYRPGYNEANLLNTVNVNLRGATDSQNQSVWTPFVTKINYDAKGQREEIEYANGVVTEYTYDPLTFRLVGLNTISTSNNTTLQDLTYTYDPVGNIMEIHDDAQQTVFFLNSKIEPHNRYEYDALYRLIKADGREHAGQASNYQRNQNEFQYMDVPNTSDAQALRNYIEEFNYDEVGNIMSMVHRLGRLSDSNPGQEKWKRRYQYATNSNRLLSTSRMGDADVPEYSDTETYSDIYDYDSHGNMTSMPHLTLMQWDYDDQLQATSKQVVNNGSEPETTWYIYDASGQRVRKVTEHQPNGNEPPTRFKERIYLDGFEIYRDYKSDGTSIKLERETLHIMDDEQRIAMAETRTKGVNATSLTPTPIIRYQLSNHLGSSSLELDEINGSVISYEEYYPYGNTSYHAAKSGVDVSRKRYRYTGKEKDDETGLYYHGARYYACWLGRWVSADPLLLTSPNAILEHPMESGLYVYTSNNPVNYVDSLGTKKYKPKELADAFNKYYWKYRKKKGVIPPKQRRMLNKIVSSMGNYPSGSKLCGLVSWQYLSQLMDMKTVGVAPVIPASSLKKLQRRYPNTSKWKTVFDRKKMSGLPTDKEIEKWTKSKDNKNPKKITDYFEMIDGEWNAKIKTATGHKYVPMKMFDLIRFGGSGSPHYIVWLGGSNPKNPLVIDCLPMGNKVTTVSDAVDPNLKILKILRSEAIENDLGIPVNQLFRDESYPWFMGSVVTPTPRKSLYVTPGVSPYPKTSVERLTLSY